MIDSETDDKLREVRALLNLYDNAISKQRNLLNQANNGILRYTQIDDKILIALIKGDLKLLQDKKCDLEANVEELERKLERELETYQA